MTFLLNALQLNESGISIEAKVGQNGTWFELVVASGDTTGISWHSLLSGYTYCFRARALNGAGYSGYSNEACATTFLAPPAAPVNAVAAPYSGGQLGISWSSQSYNESGFAVEMKVANGGSYYQVAIAPAQTEGIGVEQVVPNTLYCFRVRAFNTAGYSDYSNEACITSLNVPPAPINLSASSTTSSAISLNWVDNANNELGFKIYRWNGFTASFEFYSQLAPNSTNFNDTNLSCAADYYYQVSAFNSIGESAPAAWVKGTTAGCTNAPYLISVTGASSNQVNLSWADNSTDELGFLIERKAGNSGNWVPAATVSPNQTSFQDQDASPGMVNSYRLRAFNSLGNSNTSNIIDVTLPTPAPITTLTLDGPRLDDTISVAAGYNWYKFSIATPAVYTIDTLSGTLQDNFMHLYGPDGFNFLEFNDDGGSDYAARIIEYLNAGTYYVKVRAYSQTATGTYSIKLTTGTPPANPTALNAVAVSSNQINLSWQNNANNQTSYKVERRIEAGDWTEVVTLPANSVGYPDSGLSINTFYSYRVRAYNLAGYSDYSEAVFKQPTGSNIIHVSSFEDFGIYGDSTNPGTLSFALLNAKSGQTITFTLPDNIRLVFVYNELPQVPPGVNINGGTCGVDSQIRLDGHIMRMQANGLKLGGNNILTNLFITKFNQTQVKTFGTGNKLVCTKISKT